MGNPLVSEFLVLPITLSVVSSLSVCFITRSAPTSAITTMACIVLIKWVSTFTMRLPSLNGSKAITSENVFAIGYWLQVVWIYTQRYFTKVVQYKSIWYWAYNKAVRPILGRCITKRTISTTAGLCTYPRPAPSAEINAHWTIFIYFCPESFLNGYHVVISLMYATTVPDSISHIAKVPQVWATQT